MNKAIFLDRDGTMIEDRDYLSDPAGIVFLPGVLSALRVLSETGYMLVMVSNQSGIGRGYFTDADYFSVQERMDAMLKQEGIHFAGYYYCPHKPSDDCVCRKPKPYLALKAAVDLDIDLESSYMVGDKQSDIAFGKSFNAKGCFHIMQELVNHLGI